MITIPDGVTPTELIGETDILPGQGWLVKSLLVRYANDMVEGIFPWGLALLREPMAFQVGSNGTVISQGHHRWVAARLAGRPIPVKIQIMRDYWPDAVPFAVTWDQVVWEPE